MSSENNLVGRVVTIYLSGGWEVTGHVESVSEKKIVIKDLETRELYLSFMSKVSCLKINSEERRRSAVPPRESPHKPEYNVPKSSSNNYSDIPEFPMNKMAYDDSVMSIPQGLLDNAPKDLDDNDLSVSFGSNDIASDDFRKNGGIEFRINDDSKKED